MFQLRSTGRLRPVCNPCRSSESAAARYGTTVGHIEQLRSIQGNRCAICLTHANEIPHNAFKHNPLVIDHDHETGEVRGLLCPNCNAGLGQFKDDPRLLASAIAYLSK